MSPEANILPYQYNLLQGWIRSKEERSRKLVYDMSEGESIGVFLINGEPLVVHEIIRISERTLYCSDKHARELEKVGIVVFPKPAQEK